MRTKTKSIIGNEFSQLSCHCVPYGEKIISSPPLTLCLKIKQGMNFPVDKKFEKNIDYVRTPTKNILSPDTDSKHRLETPTRKDLSGEKRVYKYKNRQKKLKKNIE